MSIYDDPDITLEEITMEMEYLIRDMILTGLKSVSMEYRAFRQFQKKKQSEDSPIDCDERF
jgi:hypothetical protein